LTKKLWLAAAAWAIFPTVAGAQDGGSGTGSNNNAPVGLLGGTLSGDLQANVNFFHRDSSIQADNLPLYDDYLSGGESWLTLRYNTKGFTAFVRLDAFHNSNLFDPSGAPIRGFGVGAFSLHKEIGQLDVTGGFIYDQIGSGILFRAYEDRGLLIDNALVGLRVRYQPSDKLILKGYTGQQKFLFNRYQPIIKALAAEGNFGLGDGKLFLAPGLGALNRTLDGDSWLATNAAVSAGDNPFYPRYNMYAFTAYNTLTAGRFTWFAEGSYKTHEAVLRDNRFIDVPGSVLYSTLGYAQQGLAINLNAKRTENFEMRTSSLETINRGLLNWQPVIARLRPQRLISRYTPASLNLSELALGADVLITDGENRDLTLNYTHINTLEGTKLYREAYAEIEYRDFEDWIIQLGGQYLEYNQELYQIKPEAPLFRAITPFTEITRRLTDKKSIRGEAQYMHTKQDFGSWLYGLLEYNIVSGVNRWSFAISDMYLLKPAVETSPVKTKEHFYNFFVAYTKGPHRFTAQYVRQVEGINCTGGVCRYEPAFSGARIGIQSSF